MMTYFETLSRYVPDVVEAGAPILINEVALIKDTVDNEILLRITMANSVEDPVIAVAVKIHMWDVFGEEVAVSGSPVMDYVYQDIIFSPQSIYGNTVPIKMPGSVRRVEVNITKVVFSDGKVWRSVPENYVHVQAQDLLEGTDEFTDTLRGDGEKYPPLLTYVDNDESWQCTCGGVNKISDTICYRCGRGKDYCKKEYSAEPIHNKFIAFMAEKERIAEEKRMEEEEQRRRAEEELRIKREKEAEALRLKQEKEVEERRIREEIEEKERQRRKKRRTAIVFAVLLSAVTIAGVVGYRVILEPSIRYEKATLLLDNGDYSEAQAVFASLGDYKDSPIQERAARVESFFQETDLLISKKEYRSASDKLTEINGILFSLTPQLQEKYQKRLEEVKKEIAYQRANSYFAEQNFSGAINLLEDILGYKNSDELLLEAKYERVKQLMEDEMYGDAITILEEIGDYGDARNMIPELKYKFANQCINEKDYNAALPLLRDIGDYEDAINLYNKCVLEVMGEGDIVEFGRYENDGDEANGPEPIQWRVLSIRDKRRILVISSTPVEMMYFGEEGSFSWEQSIIRKWLNTDFYNESFSESERKKILETSVITPTRDGEERTKDYIFLPGASFVEKYLPKSKWTWSLNENRYLSQQADSHKWKLCCWLRNPAEQGNDVKLVDISGDYSVFEALASEVYAVRPIMWIDFSEAAQKAEDGTVSYDINIVKDAHAANKDASVTSEKTASDSKTSPAKSGGSSSSSSTSESSKSSSSSSSSSSSLGDSGSSSSGYGYDPNDPYYSAADHDGDGKINDDEFQEAMGNAIDDLYALIGE